MTRKTTQEQVEGHTPRGKQVHVSNVFTTTPLIEILDFSFGGFRFSAELLIAFALVSQEPAEVLNSGLPCKGL